MAKSWIVKGDAEISEDIKKAIFHAYQLSDEEIRAEIIDVIMNDWYGSSNAFLDECAIILREKHQPQRRIGWPFSKPTEDIVPSVRVKSKRFYKSDLPNKLIKIKSSRKLPKS